MNPAPFTLEEAHALWARMAIGHAQHLDETGARLLTDEIGIPGDGHVHGPDAGGSYEGVTRMFYGWGGWLSRAKRDAKLHWRNQSVDIAVAMRDALLAGTDPQSRGYWGYAPVGAPGTYDQRTVEAGHTLFAAWQSRDRVWKQLSKAQREQAVAYHERFALPPERWGNNWALFWALNHLSRAALGERHDPALIHDVYGRYLDGVYCGDGWYDDADVRGKQQFDDYNLWVFASHVGMALHLKDHVPGLPLGDDIAATLRDRLRAAMEHVPQFFAANGAYAHYGRSLIYKFARLSGPLWAYATGAWPHAPGLLKRIVGRHLRWHVDRGAVAANGLLRQPITLQGSAEVRDPYNASGSQYWAMQAFGALWAIDDDDPFWSCAEEPLPVEQGSFVRVHPVPGWVIAGTKATGHVQRFNAGSTHQPPSAMPAKYDKFVYSTLAGFNAGYAQDVASPDGALLLGDGAAWAHRCGNNAFAVGAFDKDVAWLRMRYGMQLGEHLHSVDTSILVFGECHIRAHRVTLDPACATPIQAVEGSAPLGYSPGIVMSIGLGKTSIAANAVVAAGSDRSAAGRKIAIRNIRGYDEVEVIQSWLGRGDLHSEYAHFAMPVLKVASVQPKHELVCAVHIGGVDATRSRDLIDSVREATWTADGAFTLATSDGIRWVTPPLPQMP